MRPPIILMIESNGEAVELARFALWRSNFHCVLQWYDEADAAIDGLLHRHRLDDARLPDLILLDPGMMENNGVDFILAMKAGRDTRSIPVVVFPDSDYPPEMPDLLEAGASAYLLKPETAPQYMQAVVECAQRWARPRRRRSGSGAARRKPPTSA